MSQTENLQLIPCGPSHPATVLEDEKGLGPLPGLKTPDGWPVSPEAISCIHETLPEGHASIRVLEKSGMGFAGLTERVLRWRLKRQDFREGGAL